MADWLAVHQWLNENNVLVRPYWDEDMGHIIVRISYRNLGTERVTVMAVRDPPDYHGNRNEYFIWSVLDSSRDISADVIIRVAYDLGLDCRDLLARSGVFATAAELQKWMDLVSRARKEIGFDLTPLTDVLEIDGEQVQQLVEYQDELHSRVEDLAGEGA